MSRSWRPQVSGKRNGLCFPRITGCWLASSNDLKSTVVVAQEFDYAAAFSRNLGLVDPEEQETLKKSRVAIAGLGGVGGVHLTTLARMGIGRIRIADFDHFEIHNINRQAGATVSTLRRKWNAIQKVLRRKMSPDFWKKSM